MGDKTTLVETLRYLRIIKRTFRLQFQRRASVEEAALATRLDAFAGWTEPEGDLCNVGRICTKKYPARVYNRPRAP